MATKYKIYKLSQNVNNGWNTYDSCVVVAENEDQAKSIHPNGISVTRDCDGGYESYYDPVWAVREDVKVEEIGRAEPKKYDKPQVIVASFNTG